MVIDPGFQVTIQGVDSRLEHWVFVNVAHGLFDIAHEMIGDEQRAFIALMLKEPLEAVVGLETRARRAAKRAVGGPLFLHQMLDAHAHDFVMKFCAFQRRLIGQALGGSQDRKRRLGDNFALAAHPSKGIVVVRGANVNQRAFFGVGD